MSKFHISLNGKELDSEGDLVASGSLKIGDFVENFHASLSYWAKSRYLSQWEEALKRLLNGKKCSAIVTSMYEPSTANFIIWWVMYLIGDNVHIQNHVLFLDELEQPFDESDIYQFIPEHEIHTEEGEPLSEWVISISKIREYLGC